MEAFSEKATVLNNRFNFNKFNNWQIKANKTKISNVFETSLDNQYTKNVLDFFESLTFIPDVNIDFIKDKINIHDITEKNNKISNYKHYVTKLSPFVAHYDFRLFYVLNNDSKSTIVYNLQTASFTSNGLIKITLEGIQRATSNLNIDDVERAGRELLEADKASHDTNKFSIQHINFTNVKSDIFLLVIRPKNLISKLDSNQFIYKSFPNKSTNELSVNFDEAFKDIETYLRSASFTKVHLKICSERADQLKGTITSLATKHRLFNKFLDYILFSYSKNTNQINYITPLSLFNLQEPSIINDINAKALEIIKLGDEENYKLNSITGHDLDFSFDKIIVVQDIPDLRLRLFVRYNFFKNTGSIEIAHESNRSYYNRIDVNNTILDNFNLQHNNKKKPDALKSNDTYTSLILKSRLIIPPENINFLKENTDVLNGIVAYFKSTNNNIRHEGNIRCTYHLNASSKRFLSDNCTNIFANNTFNLSALMGVVPFNYLNNVFINNYNLYINKNHSQLTKIATTNLEKVKAESIAILEKGLSRLEKSPSFDYSSTSVSGQSLKIFKDKVQFNNQELRVDNVFIQSSLSEIEGYFDGFDVNDFLNISFLYKIQNFKTPEDCKKTCEEVVFKDIPRLEAEFRENLIKSEKVDPVKKLKATPPCFVNALKGALMVYFWHPTGDSKEYRTWVLDYSSTYVNKYVSKEHIELLNTLGPKFLGPNFVEAIESYITLVKQYTVSFHSHILDLYTKYYNFAKSLRNRTNLFTICNRNANYNHENFLFSNLYFCESTLKQNKYSVFNNFESLYNFYMDHICPSRLFKPSELKSNNSFQNSNEIILINGRFGSVDIEIKAKKDTADNVRYYINNSKILFDELTLVLKSALCFNNQSDFNAYLKDISNLSLTLRNMISEPVRFNIILTKNTSSNERKVIRTYLEFSKSGDRFFVIIRNFDGSVFSSHEIVEKIQVFVSKFKALKKAESVDLSYDMSLNDFIKLFSGVPTFGAESLIKLLSTGESNYELRILRSRKLLEDTVKLVKAEYGTFTYGTTTLSGYAVTGASGTKYLVTYDKTTSQASDSHGTKNIGAVYSLPTLEYVCIVDKSNKQAGFDIVVNRLLALKNDLYVSNHVTTLNKYVR